LNVHVSSVQLLEKSPSISGRQGADGPRQRQPRAQPGGSGTLEQSSNFDTALARQSPRPTAFIDSSGAVSLADDMVSRMNTNNVIQQFGNVGNITKLVNSAGERLSEDPNSQDPGAMSVLDIRRIAAAAAAKHHHLNFIPGEHIGHVTA
jgi:hypothetical protein